MLTFLVYEQNLIVDMDKLMNSKFGIGLLKSVFDEGVLVSGI